MSNRIRAHIRSNVIGYVALFFAISGTAMALPGTNTVNSGDIINEEVRAADIRENAVGSSELRTDAVGSAVIRADAVGSSEIVTDAVGSSEIVTDAVGASEISNNAIDQGEVAPNGIGADELTTINRRSATSAPIANNSSGNVGVQCNAGEQVIGGGNDASTVASGFAVIASRNDGANGWRVFIRNQTGSNQTVTVHAYCLQQ